MIHAASRGAVRPEPQEGTVPLVAVTYTAEVLGDRPVVRLVEANLREAEDLTLRVVGLTADEGRDTPVVGHAAQRALGFPEWPMVTDPADARLALDTADQLKRVMKRAASRRQATARAVEALAIDLGRVAPHFLPTFYEEAARGMLAVEQTHFASRFFSKAREAERVHALAIDEDRQAAAFLEFALAGAITTKELSAESKALLDRLEPPEALDRFTTLARERAWAGSPPYAALWTDVRRLAKAAGNKAAEGEVLRDLLDSPSIARAPKGFWSSSRAAVIRLAQAEDGVQERLLELVPDWGRWTGMDHDFWIDLLTEAGALDLITSGSADAAAWVQRISSHAPYSQRLAQVIHTLGDHLRGARIDLDGGANYSADPEILEALLAVGATLNTEVVERVHFRAWVRRPDRGDLPHLAAHPDLAGKVALGEHVSRDLPTLLDYAGSRDLLRRYATTDLPEALSLPAFERVMTRYLPLVTPEAVPVLSDQLEPVFHLMHPPKVIADVLRLGLPAEMSWPMLESVVQRARAEQPGADVSLTLSWPAVGVVVGDSVTFVDGDRVVAAHTVGQGRDHSFTLVKGDVLAHFGTGVRGPRASSAAQWASSPGALLDPGPVFGLAGGLLSHEVPGGRLNHLGILRPGEAMPEDAQYRSHVLSDGRRFWVADNPMLPLDPDTGRRGRETSVPAVLTDLARGHVGGGLRLNPGRSLLAPVTPTTAGSRVSTADGLHCVVALSEGHDLCSLVLADGTRVDLPRDAPAQTPWVLDRPGGGRWLVRDAALHDLGTGQELGEFRDGWGMTHPVSLLPAAAWHQLQVRDESASRRLRSIGPEQAERLWDAIVAVQARSPRLDVWFLLRELTRPDARAMSLAAEILRTTDATLCREVVIAASWAGWRASWWFHEMQPAREAARRGGAAGAESEVVATLPWPVTDLGGLAAMYMEPTYTVRPHFIHVIAGRLGLGPDVEHRRHIWSTLPWHVLAHGRAVLFLAASPFRTREELESIAGLIGAMNDVGLWDEVRPGWVPTSVIQTPRGTRHGEGTILSAETSAGPDEGRVLLLDKDHRGSDLAPDLVPVLVRGQASTVRGLPITWPQTHEAVGATALIAVLERLLEHGPPSWDPASAEALAERTGWTLPMASLLLASPSDMWDPRSNFLSTDVREALGLTVAEAEVARHELRRIHREVVPLPVLLGAGVPVEDPARIVGGPDIEAIARAWNDHAPPDEDQPRLPPEVLVEASKAIGEDWRFDRLRKGDAPAMADLHVLLWLAYRLPRDSPMREWIADSLDDVRQALRIDSTRVRIAEVGEYSAGDRARARRSLGLPPKEPGTPSRQFALGQLTLVEEHGYDRIYVVPSQVTEWAPVLDQIRGLRRLPLYSRPSWELELLVDDHLDRLIADLRTREDAEHHDPRVSAWDVVGDVTSALGLSEDAAVYWLQLLALADPTDRHVRDWNGWTSPRRKKAGGELLDRGLVVGAKRARAGRSLFLPGGWLEAKPPHLPLEEWKAAPFALLDEPKVTPALGVVVPFDPIADLFRRAWARWTDGDRPGSTESTEDA